MGDLITTVARPATIKRQHSAEFKTNVVLELLREEDTVSQICSKYSIHPTQARRWRDYVLQIVRQSFNGKTINQELKEKDRLIEDLYGQIGKLNYQLDWLKKKMGYTS
jgi:putative transposase